MLKKLARVENIKMFNDNLKYFSSGIVTMLSIGSGLLTLITLNDIYDNILVFIFLACFAVSFISVNITFYIKQKNFSL